MEHIVQFGINLDDASIAEAVKRDAYKEVIKQLTDERARRCRGSAPTAATAKGRSIGAASSTRRSRRGSARSSTRDMTI